MSAAAGKPAHQANITKKWCDSHLAFLNVIILADIRAANNHNLLLPVTIDELVPCQKHRELTELSMPALGRKRRWEREAKGCRLTHRWLQ